MTMNFDNVIICSHPSLHLKNDDLELFGYKWILEFGREIDVNVEQFLAKELTLEIIGFAPKKEDGF